MAELDRERARLGQAGRSSTEARSSARHSWGRPASRSASRSAPDSASRAHHPVDQPMPGLVGSSPGGRRAIRSRARPVPISARSLTAAAVDERGTPTARRNAEGRVEAATADRTRSPVPGRRRRRTLDRGDHRLVQPHPRLGPIGASRSAPTRLSIAFEVAPAKSSAAPRSTATRASSLASSSRKASASASAGRRSTAFDLPAGR